MSQKPPMVDTAKVHLEAALGALQPSPSAEPVYAQTDNATIQSLIDACTVYGWMKNETGGYTRIVDYVQYPRILRLVSMTAHLEVNTRYNLNEARIAWFDSKHEIRKLTAVHSKDPLARSLLDEIMRLRYRTIFGDALNGHKQLHIQKISGAERKVTVAREGRRRGVGGIF